MVLSQLHATFRTVCRRLPAPFLLASAVLTVGVVGFVATFDKPVYRSLLPAVTHGRTLALSAPLKPEATPAVRMQPGDLAEVADAAPAALSEEAVPERLVLAAPTGRAPLAAPTLESAAPPPQPEAAPVEPPAPTEAVAGEAPPLPSAVAAFDAGTTLFETALAEAQANGAGGDGRTANTPPPGPQPAELPLPTPDVPPVTDSNVGESKDHGNSSQPAKKDSAPPKDQPDSPKADQPAKSPPPKPAKDKSH